MKMHEKENNSESKSHLEENKKHFSQQCKKVLQLLLDGKRLTVKSAMNHYGVWSLPRRCLDLKENGVSIETEWIIDHDGKSKIKQYFLSPKSESEKKELQKFLTDLQQELPPIKPEPVVQIKMHL